MKKLAITLSLIFIVALTVGTISACDGEYKVEFYISGKLVYTEKTEEGRFTYKAPSEYNAVFDGWYKDEEYKERFYGDTVTKNTKLYGRYVHSPVPGYDPD